MRHLALALLSLVLLQPGNAWAQEPDGPRIGLVLSGGGARGIAHVGVLKVLEELQIPVHFVTGTSMGAVIGSLYAAGYSPAELEEIITTTDWPDAFEDNTARRDLSFRRKEDDLNFLTSARFGIQEGGIAIPAGFIQGQKLNLLLRRLLIRTAGLESFDALHLPFRAVSTDLVDGSEVVHAKGDVATSVRASMSIPGVFQPVAVDGRLLVDGMLVNNLPIGLALDLGADVIIAVDVGTPLRPLGELNDAVAVADQVLTIATDRMAEIQRQKLRDGDILLTPSLAEIGAADFERGSEIIPIGEAAARDVASRLSRFAVSGATWDAHLARQRHGAEEPLVIDRVEFVNDSTVSDDLILSQIEDQAGKPLEIAQLEEDIAAIHGSGTFQRVDYAVHQDRGETVLRVEAHQKSWGPQYLRVGLNLEENFDNTSIYNLAFNYTINPVNSRGGEWRNELQIGNTIRVFSEFWQPLDRESRWFVAPGISFSRTTVALYEGDDRTGEFSLRRTELGLDVGRQLSNWGEIRAGIRWQDGRAGPLVGARTFQGTEVDGGGFFLRLAADTLDAADYPTEGVFARATLAALRDSLGSGADSELIQLQVASAHSFGHQTIVLSVNGVTQFGDGIDRIENVSRIGGFLNLSGLDRGQLSGAHSIVARALTYRQLADFGVLNFRFPVYLGASIELGNVWSSRREISVDSAILAGSVFLGWRTPLGPLYVGYGVAEGGQDSAYLFLGRTF